MASWSTPISPAAPSTISSGLRCRRCCGANCRAAARPAACNRWRCASSASAKPRSRRFKAREYWTIEVEFKTEAGDRFTARLSHLDGKKLDRFDLDTEAKARAAAEAILAGDGFTVASVEHREVRRNPFPPFTTSTLQQEASRKLGFGASRTMQMAQRLYEGIDLDGETVGLITYMRTDGVAIAAEAIAAARATDRQRIRRPLCAGASRASIAARPRTRRKRTRRSARPTWPAARPMSPAISTTTSAASTS